MTDVDAEIRTAGFNPLRMQIVSERGQEADVHPQQAQVMRDVPPDTPEADRDLSRVGIVFDQGPHRSAADVDVDSADHRHIGRAAHHVSTASNMSLFHQVRDMHRHCGTGDSRLSCQLFL